MPKVPCFNSKSISINIRFLAERSRLCQRSSERKNELVNGEKCHMLSCSFLQLCHIPSGLAICTVRNQRES
jgi:hypothetical protein